MELLRPSLVVPAGARLPASRAGTEATLLVVDDNEMNREVISRFFESKGYTVTPAEGGQAAFEAVDALPVDLVMLDIMMPEISGIDVLKWIRARRSVADLPVIMLTALDTESDRIAGFAAGADAYFLKPVDDAILFGRMDALLSGEPAAAKVG